MAPEGPWPARLPGLDVEAGIASASGNRRLYRRLLGKFTAQYAAAPETFRQWLGSGRMEDARQLAHTIKGAAATLGADDLRRAARALETAIRERLDASAPLRRFEAALAEALGSMEHLSDITAAPGTPPPPVADAGPPQTVQPLLEELAVRVRNGCTDAADCMAAIRERLGGSLSDPKLLFLEAHVDAYEFDAAAAVLDEILKSTDARPGPGPGDERNPAP